MKNMNTEYMLIIILFLIIIPGVPAQECIIEYIEGILEILQDEMWLEAEEGDVLPVTAILQTHDNTLVEIRIDNELFIISEKGVYSIESIIVNSRNASSWNIGRIIERKIAIFIEDDIIQKEAVAGVRGDDIHPDDLNWMETSEYVVWEGQKIINNGEYKAALEYFQDAFSNAFGEREKSEYLFYIGYCYALLGDKMLALQTLSEVDAQEDTVYYGHYVLLKGHLLAESLSFQKALDLADGYLKKFPAGDYAQAVNFLSAFCYNRLNNKEKAIVVLKRAYVIDPDSPIGIEAKKQIKDLENK